MKKALLTFVTLGLAVASAASSYRVKFFQPSIVAGKELQPGVYKVELKDDKAIISKGREAVEAAVRTEAAGAKFASTSVRYRNGDGKYRLEEIRLGGTNTRIVFR